MSRVDVVVNFTAIKHADAWSFTCRHVENGRGTTGHRYPSFNEALTALKAEASRAGGTTGHLAVCGHPRCTTAPMVVTAVHKVQGPEVDLPVAQAAIMLRVLGFTVDPLCGVDGVLDAADLMERLDTMAPAAEILREVGAFALDAGLPVSFQETNRSTRPFRSITGPHR